MPERYCVGPSMATDWGDEKPAVNWCLLWRVLGYFRPYWRRALLVLACIGADASLGLVPALVTKALIDDLAHPRGGFAYLALIVGAGVAATIASGLVGVLQSYLTTAISQGIMFDLRQQLFGRLLRQSVGFFTRSRTGDLLSRMNNDVGGIADVVSDTVFGTVSSLVVALSTLAVMVRLDWRLTLAALVLLPLVLVPSRAVGRANYRARQREYERSPVYGISPFRSDRGRPSTSSTHRSYNGPRDRTSTTERRGCGDDADRSALLPLHAVSEAAEPLLPWRSRSATWAACR